MAKELDCGKMMEANDDRNWNKDCFKRISSKYENKNCVSLPITRTNSIRHARSIPKMLFFDFILTTTILTFVVAKGVANETTTAGVFTKVATQVPFAMETGSGDECRLERTNLDAIFLIDGSFSIEPVDFGKGLRFVSNFVDFLISQGMELEDDAARIGVIEYSTEVQVWIPLGSISSPLLLKNKIENLNQSDGMTYTGAGLLAMEEEFERNRREDPRLLLGFVLTDGVSDDGLLLRQKSADLRANNVTLYAIGVGAASEDELRIIAGENEEEGEDDDNNDDLGIVISPRSSFSSSSSFSPPPSPNATRVFHVENYNDLRAISRRFFSQVCASIADSWREIFAKPEVIVPMGVIVAAVVATVVCLIVVWRLSILARRRLALRELHEAANELRRSQSDINRLYMSPVTTSARTTMMTTTDE